MQYYVGCKLILRKLHHEDTNNDHNYYMKVSKWYLIVYTLMAISAYVFQVIALPDC